jgi:hypothetical protein
MRESTDTVAEDLRALHRRQADAANKHITAVFGIQDAQSESESESESEPGDQGDGDSEQAC